MKHRQRIDKIIESVQTQIQEEVGGLIGAELTLTLIPGEIISKEDFFSQPLAKQVFAKMDITGEVEGKGGLLLSVKDAIRLGGTLIMLPPAELDEVISNEEYDGETEDSYGEIANIIAGSYTKVFEEMFPKACRFIRKEQEVIVPKKIDIASDEPIPDDTYFQITSKMQLDGTSMGELIMLIPAVPFGLAEPKQRLASSDSDSAVVIETADEAEETQQEGGVSTEPDLETSATDNNSNAGDAGDTNEIASQTTVEQSLSPAERAQQLEKQKKTIDGLLGMCQTKVQEEVGALLGVEVQCSDLENKIVTKEDFFFDETTGKQVVANMEVVGDVEDTSYLFVSLKDAIRIGCTLIMLPPSELETSVSEDDFNEDSQDAYGEIANIISGVYTAVFEEQYQKSLRFIKKDIDQVAPMKVDIDSDEPIPQIPYYLSSMQFSMNGNAYGKLQMLFPARLFELEQLADEAEPDSAKDHYSNEGNTAGSVTGSAFAAQEKTPPIHAAQNTMEQGAEDVLVISDSDSDSEQIKTTLIAQGMSVMVLSFRDNVSKYLPGQFKAIFLVSKQVNEQSFGMAIKISTACSLPVIAAGPDWTRSKVIKAVKYGVTDILLTPASESDICEKIQNSISQLAA